MEYRQAERIKREERKRQRQSENRLYQVMIETQYGLTTDSISTPDQNSNFTNKQQGVNMAKTTSSTVLERLQRATDLLEKTVESGWSVFQEMWSGINSIDETRNLLLAKLTQAIKSVFPILIET